MISIDTNVLLTGSVGRGGRNNPMDVKAVHQKLMKIGKIPCYSCSGFIDNTLVKAIEDIQRHFMVNPDGIILADMSSYTLGFLDNWEYKTIKPGVNFGEYSKLKQAWDLVDPLLPKGSWCESAYRSAEKQRKILQDYFLLTYRQKIIDFFGNDAFLKVEKNMPAVGKKTLSSDEFDNETEMLKMVKEFQEISRPGESAHQSGCAIDIQGEKSQADVRFRVVSLVAHAHQDLFDISKIIKEKNGCVHFEVLKPKAGANSA